MNHALTVCKISKLDPYKYVYIYVCVYVYIYIRLSFLGGERYPRWKSNESQGERRPRAAAPCGANGHLEFEVGRANYR